MINQVNEQFMGDLKKKRKIQIEKRKNLCNLISLMINTKDDGREIFFKNENKNSIIIQIDEFD